MIELARDALRWIASQSVQAEGGLTWDRPNWPDLLADDLYEGTAGVLVGLAEAHLTGITEYDDLAQAAATRLEWMVGRIVAAGGPPADFSEPERELWASFYLGLAGYVTALSMWATVSGDTASAQAAEAGIGLLAEVAPKQRLSASYEVIHGEAGVLLALVALGGRDAGPAIEAIADRLVAATAWQGDEPDWYKNDSYKFLQPNFSHGAAGIGFALARASMVTDRPDLLDLAARVGHRLVRLGARPDGTLAVPYKIYPPADPEPHVTYGWCHGPAGTSRLFELLDRLRPGEHWADHATACRVTVRTSGLPARLRPGFWDNLGQCCGTAGVGERVLDWYRETGDPGWLDWADKLAADLLARSITDDAGTRWSNTEHKADPPDLPPQVGWMQGAAGIAGFLLRLARTHAAGPGATRLPFPDGEPVPVPAQVAVPRIGES
ncbi:MAG TPA: lanthionine synthetase LanC family protein [Streptosporangiaceae bacterium]|nr:lanthionine synthetase LanC family protein [Streptosporangiaceae bacterium]